MPPETRYARSGDTNIAYQVVGRGGNDLVVGLGWVSNLDAFWEEPRFARFVERLSTFARVILYDKRGTGLSDSIPLDRTHSLRDRVDDVKAVLDAVGSSRAALFDISAGGAIAALFAATYPELTTNLILFASFARRRSSDDYPWGRTADAEAELLERPWGSLAQADTPMPSSAADPEFAQWWASYLRRSAGPGTARALARLNTQIDIRDELSHIGVPTLILHRTGDRIVTVENGRFLANQIPTATLRELPGEDHLPFTGDQDLVLAEIERFLVGSGETGNLHQPLTALLATELVSPVETAVRLGDSRWTELCRWRRTLVRTLVAKDGGREVAYLLDGSIALFPRPGDAISCAKHIIDESRANGIPMRAGLHMGEVAMVDDVVAGVALHIASHVMEHAGAGEVLVSGPAHDLMIGSAAQFDLIGAQVFAGIPGEWRIYRLAPDGAGVESRSPLAERAGTRPIADLSRREREIAALLALGLANRQIADELIISVATVERHVANILMKLGFRSRAHVAAWAVEQGLLHTGANSRATR